MVGCACRFLLLLALSFHSFMEGLGLGANEDPYAPLVAVLSHKVHPGLA